MTTRTSFSLKGFEEYLENIVQSGEDVDAAAAEAVSDGGDIVLGEMQLLVPKLSGQLLRALMRTEPKRIGNFTFIEVGMPNKHEALSAGATRVELADTARYGNAQEYGYQRGGKFYPPQSYIRAGFDKSKTRMRRAMREALKAKGLVD